MSSFLVKGYWCKSDWRLSSNGEKLITAKATRIGPTSMASTSLKVTSHTRRAGTMIMTTPTSASQSSGTDLLGSKSYPKWPSFQARQSRTSSAAGRGFTTERLPHSTWAEKSKIPIRHTQMKKKNPSATQHNINSTGKVLSHARISPFTFSSGARIIEKAWKQQQHRCRRNWGTIKGYVIC